MYVEHIVFVRYLNKLVRQTSPYGVDVAKSLSDFVNESDKQLMNIYLKIICSTVAEVLKRQRGNQYGFGDDPNSDELVTRNLTDLLLDDADITTTKPIENFFGNLDQELKKTGSKGFGKVGYDLIIKYSKDLLKSNAFEWQTKETREKAK